MTRRHYPDEAEQSAYQRTGTADLPLFADRRASIEAGMAALADTAAKHEASIQALIPLARELAAKVGAAGITVSDLRIVAVQRGLLTGQETGRQLSWTGAVLSRAGLEPTGEWRRSAVVKSHGNPHRVFRLPEAQDGAA